MGCGKDVSFDGNMPFGVQSGGIWYEAGNGADSGRILRKQRKIGTSERSEVLFLCCFWGWLHGVVMKNFLWKKVVSIFTSGGDMSLVGTRPPTVDEYEQYECNGKDNNYKKNKIMHKNTFLSD